MALLTIPRALFVPRMELNVVWARDSLRKDMMYVVDIFTRHFQILHIMVQTKRTPTPIKPIHSTQLRRPTSSPFVAVCPWARACIRFWVAVKELKLSDHNPETIFITIYLYIMVVSN